MKTTITLENCKTYASEANLMKAIERLELDEIRHIVCRAPDGRWTAIFLVTEWINLRKGCYLGVASQHGFMSV